MKRLNLITMKIINLISTLLVVFLVTVVYPVHAQHNDLEGSYSDHGPFIKRIEFNKLIPGGGFNVEAKSKLELKLFGESNAFVEFYHLPKRAGASGFRILKDESTGSYLLEAKYVSNYDALLKETSEKYPTIAVSGPDAVSKDSLQKITAYNGAQIRKQSEEMLERYTIENFTLEVTPRFAEELHDNMTSFIGNFKGEGVPPVIKGGHRVVFRSVVADEVWSLSISNPKGHPFKERCMQILSDVKANTFQAVDKAPTELPSDCEANLENIFKTYDLKVHYDIVERLYQEAKKRETVFFSNYNYGYLNHLFTLIRGVPYFEQPTDSITMVNPGEQAEVEYMSEEAVDEYLKRLDCTPGEAYRNYYHFIRKIKLEREAYLKCIDEELAKNLDSTYRNETLRYDVFQGPPLLAEFPVISKFHFLKLFKEFILIDDEALLPDYFRAMVYLDCGSKTPYFRERYSKYGVDENNNH